MAILTLLVVGFSQVVNLMSNAWRDGQDRVDNYTRARGMLDLISQDLQSAVFRNDVGAFVDQNGNNQDSDGKPIYAFYTQRSGLSATTDPLRSVSLVAYTLDPHRAVLQRGDMAVPWANAASLVSFGNLAALPKYPDVTSRTASPGIIAFKLVFLRANGDVDTLYSPNPVGNPVKAVGISLAVLDQNTIDKMGAQKLSDLTLDPVWDLPLGAGTLVLNNSDIKYLWNSKTIADPSFSAAYPLLRGSLVIFERFVPLLGIPNS